MFKTGFSPASLLRKYSRLGLSSFFIAMIIALIVIGYLAVVLRMENTPSAVQSFAAIDTIVTCLIPIMTLAGLGLGIAAVVQKQKNRLFGFVGLIVNSLFMLGIFSLYVINILTLTRTAGG